MLLHKNVIVKWEMVVIANTWVQLGVQFDFALLSTNLVSKSMFQFPFCSCFS